MLALEYHSIKVSAVIVTTDIEDVHKFPGHIACDSATNSELVIPIIQDSKVVALLDIDSIEFDRFTNDEVNAFSEVTKSIFNKIIF